MVNERVGPVGGDPTHVHYRDSTNLRVCKIITSRKLWLVSDGSPEFTAGRATQTQAYAGTVRDRPEREIVYLQTLTRINRN